MSTPRVNYFKIKPKFFFLMAYKEEFLFSFSSTVSYTLLNVANRSLPCFKIICKCIPPLTDLLRQGQFSAYITIPTLP